jgi:hypothetical protein
MSVYTLGCVQRPQQSLRTRDNTHAVRERRYQVRSIVSVWAGIVGEIVVGPCLVLYRLTVQRYHGFLETFLQELLKICL